MRCSSSWRQVIEFQQQKVLHGAVVAFDLAPGWTSYVQHDRLLGMMGRTTGVTDVLLLKVLLQIFGHVS